MSEIQKLEALEILDSRGNPTIAVTVTLNNGVKATAKIPSGASTGTREAVELRDGDTRRYGGKGVLNACAHVEGAILSAVRGMDPSAQTVLDRALCTLDGTANKSRLGANAILGVSLAGTEYGGDGCLNPSPPLRLLIDARTPFAYFCVGLK